MKHYLKRTFAIACIFALILTGCSKSGDSGNAGTDKSTDSSNVGIADGGSANVVNTDMSQMVDRNYWATMDEYVWRQADEGKWELPKDMVVWDTKFMGENVYYTVDGSLGWFEPDTDRGSICGYSLTEKKELFRFDISEFTKVLSDFAGQYEWGHVDQFCGNEDGNLCFLAEIKDLNGELSSFIVTYKVAEGNFECVRISRDFPEIRGEISNNLVEFVSGKAGSFIASVYISAEGVAGYYSSYIISADGSVSEISALKGVNISSMFKYGGSVWYSSYYNDGYYIFEIDEKGEVVQRKPGFSNGSVSGIIGGEPVVRGDAGIFVYNPDTEEAEELFSWINIDMLSDEVVNTYVVNDDCIAVVENDSIEFVERVKKTDYVADDREELVLGCLYRLGYVERNVLEFNKSQDKYHVTVKEYNNRSSETTTEEALTRFNLDLASGKAPDIINIQNFDMENLVGKGLVENLEDYIETDADISREDYIEGVLRACTIDDVLFTIPIEFLVESYAGRASEVGEKPGWTIKDINTYLKNSGKSLPKYWTREGTVELFLSYALDEFVDTEKGVCNFEVDSFNALLEMVSELLQSYEEFSWSLVDDSEEVMSSTAFGSFRDIQQLETQYGNDYVIKGYPTSDGREQHRLENIDAYSILSASANKEGAWEFIKFSLQNISDDEVHLFTADKNVMQELIDAELAHAGEETQKQYYTRWGTSYYHYATQEEIDTVMSMLNHVSIYKKSEEQIIDIIKEEIESYFAGIKSEEEVAAIIQDRVQIYLDEQK